MAAAEFARWRADPSRAPPFVVDVREPWEFAYCRIEGAVSIPLSELAHRQGELPKERPLVLVCHHGHRSQHAAMLLKGAGFEHVHNLRGGVEAYAVEVDTAMKRY